MEIRCNEILAKVARGESLTARQRHALTNAPAGTVDPGIASAMRYSGSDLFGAARFGLKIDDKRNVLALAIHRAVEGRFPPEDERAIFLSQVRSQAGNPPDSILLGLDLSLQAGWDHVSDAIERRMSAKTKRAA